MIRPLPSPRRLVLALAACLAAGLAGCSRPAPASLPEDVVAKAPPKIRFKVDWYPQAEHGGFYQAQAKGFYKDAGIDVDIIPGGPGVLVTQMMLTGNIDIAVGRSDDIPVLVSKGIPFVIVAVYMERDPQAILVHEESSVHSFADLNGKSIMGVQGSNWIEFIKNRYHIDFSLIPLNYGIAQFMADKDFIQQCFVTNEPYYVIKNGGHPRTLLMSDSGFRPYRILFTTQGYLKGHEELIRAFIAASLRGWSDFMNGDPAPGKALIAKSNPNMPDEFMDYSIKAMHEAHIVEGKPEDGERIGLMTRKRLEEQVADLAMLKIIPEPIPIDNFTRFDLLPLDLQRDAK